MCPVRASLKARAVCRFDMWASSCSTTYSMARGGSAARLRLKTTSPVRGASSTCVSWRGCGAGGTEAEPPLPPDECVEAAMEFAAETFDVPRFRRHPAGRAHGRQAGWRFVGRGFDGGSWTRPVAGRTSNTCTAPRNPCSPVTYRSSAGAAKQRCGPGWRIHWFWRRRTPRCAPDVRSGADTVTSVGRYAQLILRVCA